MFVSNNLVHEKSTEKIVPDFLNVRGLASYGSTNLRTVRRLQLSSMFSGDRAEKCIEQAE